MELPKDINSTNVAQAVTPDRSQKIMFSSSPVRSNTFDADTNLIRIFATKDCWVRLCTDTSTSAAVNDGVSQFVPAGILIFLGTKVNKITMATNISIIRDQDDGALHLLEAN